MNNNIQVYQYNTLLLTVNVSTDTDITLSQYTPYMKILTGNTAYSITGSTISVSGRSAWYDIINYWKTNISSTF